MPDMTDTKETVRELQTYLRTLHYCNAAHPHVSSDGIYGKETENAVRIFQESASLPVTGQADYRTWEALRTQCRLCTEQYAPGTPLYTVYCPTVLSEEPLPPYLILSVQTILYTLQGILLPYGIRAFPTDGVWNADTAAAIRVLQKITLLPETGSLNLATWNMLASLYNLEIKKRQSVT